MARLNCCFYNVIATIVAGKPVSDEKVWDGAGLEWTVPTPAPYHTFEEPPLVLNPRARFKAGFSVGSEVVVSISRVPAIDTALSWWGCCGDVRICFVLMVPLYNVLCDALGINGKTSSQAYGHPAAVDESREVTVQFVAINNDGMPGRLNRNHMCGLSGSLMAWCLRREIHGPTWWRRPCRVSPRAARPVQNRVFCFDSDYWLREMAEMPRNLLLIRHCPATFTPLRFHTLFDVLTGDRRARRAVVGD